MANTEPGRCDGELCYNPYITQVGDYYSIPSCDIDLGLPASVPIKTNLQGLSPTPFVKLRFEGELTPEGTPATPEYWDYTEITTGNISQPGNPELCKAAIKSFQYGWGAVESGNTCKIIITDEVGSSLKAWFERIFKNPSIDQITKPQGVYKMRVQWGWIISGESGDCPSDMTLVGEPFCVGPSFYGTTIIPAPSLPNNSTAPNRLICSPVVWFLPDELKVNYNGNKITFEITGIDLLKRSAEQPSALSFGTEGNKVHFKDAVKSLANTSLPPFDVVFKQIDENGNVADMQFFVPAGVAAGSPDLGTKGPLGVWNANEMSPLQTIRQWINSNAVRAKSYFIDGQGVGIAVNFDPVNRQAILWADAHPACQRTIDSSTRLKAIYINTGKCSPVLNFTPSTRYNFLSAAAAGGSSSPVYGRQSKMSDQQQLTQCKLVSRGRRAQSVASNSAMTGMGGANAQQQVQIAVAENWRATYLQYSIEAELRVQGDPSDFLCGPLAGYGRTIAIILNSPFYLEDLEGWDCPVWKQTPTSSCSLPFTSNAWFINGVDHQIMDGKYVTTYKVILFPVASDLNAGTLSGNNPITLGGTNIPIGSNEKTLTGCPQGCFPCSSSGWYMAGAITGTTYNGVGIDTAGVPGTDVFCERDCSGAIGVT
jgi:hypothetical protein